MSQTSLLEPTPKPQRAVVDFLEGYAARYAFGEKPTATQQRQAKALAEQFAFLLAAMKAGAS